MLKKLLFIIVLFPIFSYSQVQIGNDINGDATEDFCGFYSALSNDGIFLIVGAHGNDGNGIDSGQARVFEKINNNWVQIGDDIYGLPGEEVGLFVEMSSDGSIVAVGGLNSDINGTSSGVVRVYENIGGSWIQIGQDIVGEAEFDSSGILSFSSDGSIIAIGATSNDGNGEDSGHVRVYENQGDNWVQIGNDIDGAAAGDGFGNNVSLSADGSIVAAVGRYNDDNGVDSGHVRVFKNESNSWIQIGNDINGEAAGDESYAVWLSADGTVIAIGAGTNDGNGEDSGHVRVYENIEGSWIQKGNDIDGENAGDGLGIVSLSSDGNILAVGSSFNDDNGTDSGNTKIYKYEDDNWIQVGNTIIGEAAGDLFGQVILSSDASTVSIGAILNDGNGNNSGHVRVYDLTGVLSVKDTPILNFSVFPNPAQNNITIQLLNDFELEKLNIYNCLGQFLSSTSSLKVNISHLSAGVYFVEVITNKGKSTKKLVIE